MRQKDFDDKDYYWEKYRWEFMRRNRNYLKTYDELQKFYNDDTIPQVKRVYTYNTCISGAYIRDVHAFRIHTIHLRRNLIQKRCQNILTVAIIRSYAPIDWGFQ